MLCSVREPEVSLREIMRVLRPGGQLLFIEHVASDRKGRLFWQRFAQPFWRWFADNCHLTRRTGDLIEQSGLQIEKLIDDEMPKSPAVVRRTLRGVARKSAG